MSLPELSNGLPKKKIPKKLLQIAKVVERHSNSSGQSAFFPFLSFWGDNGHRGWYVSTVG